MEREIKFRGLHRDTNEWVFGSYTHVRDVENNPSIIPIGTNIFSSVKRESVGQFTGLKDKNGVEIYEGDIVAMPEFWETAEYTSTNWVDWILVFRDGSFTTINKDHPDPDEDAPLSTAIKGYDGNIEVIGNIHQNPELLTNG